MSFINLKCLWSRSHPWIKIPSELACVLKQTRFLSSDGVSCYPYVLPFLRFVGQELGNTWKLSNRLIYYQKFPEMLERLKAKDQEAHYKDTEILKRNSEITFRDFGVAFRGRLIEKLESLLSEQDARIRQRDASLEQN